MSDAVVERTALPTVYEWQASEIENAARVMAHWVSTTAEEKLGWKPRSKEGGGEGRDIYDQVFECSQVNRRIANTLQGIPNGEWIKDSTYTSSAQATEDLKASAAELASVVRGLPDDALTREYTTGMGPMTGGVCISMALGNMYYHGGQINLIQMLLGDTEFHFPQ